ncbi:MAG: HAD-IA family hydrolase [Erysipelotrichaceae bacterium]|nr:HAD-IA family hydrolase [Erysipelotrichaceae bacterium]
MNKGIIFDLDGTLWDCEQATLDTFNEICEKHGLPAITRETVKASMGITREESIELFFPGIEDGEKYLDEAESLLAIRLHEGSATIYPGLKETIEELVKEYGLYIVSNSDDFNYIGAFVDCYGFKDHIIDYFPASAMGISKSDAIRKMVDKYELDKAIYVGDTIRDYQAASKAGVRFIFAGYGFGSFDYPYRADTCLELLALIDKIMKEE